jgi:uncharacterized protein (DUF1800 family)
MGTTRAFTAGLLASVLLLQPLGLAAAGDKDRRIAHALNRLTFGARPADTVTVKRIGLDKWIDQQLHPERLAENPQLEARLKPLESLGMDARTLMANFPPPQLIVAVASGRLPLPADPEKRQLLERLAARYKTRLEKADTKNGDAPLKLAAADRKPLIELLTPDELRTMRRGTPEDRASLLAGMPEDKLADVLFSLPQPQRRALFAFAPVEIRRKMLATAAPAQLIAHDLQEAKVYRAIYSNRQLEEVLTDFWFNHFNVYLDKGADRYLTSSYERDAIRPHILGKFRDLLQATAQHPAMLFYLDNFQSVSPDAAERGIRRRQQAPKRRRGLNENYARELLELHTLGVDGGYTQQDIVNVARAFTGWTIGQPYRDPEFFYNARMHDSGDKTVLGVKIPAGGGREDGLRVLDIVANHPSTARFVSRKLAQRFVADNPPDSLVNTMAATWRKTDGDLREVMRTMLRSREFWSDHAYRSKVKSPLEYVASAARATGADVTFAFGLAEQISKMGEPLYRKQEPTGYANTSEEWVNSGALLERMNFALALVNNKLPGVKVASDTWKANQFGGPEFQKR